MIHAYAGEHTRRRLELMLVLRLSINIVLLSSGDLKRGASIWPYGSGATAYWNYGSAPVGAGGHADSVVDFGATRASATSHIVSNYGTPGTSSFNAAGNSTSGSAYATASFGNAFSTESAIANLATASMRISSVGGPGIPNANNNGPYVYGGGNAVAALGDTLNFHVAGASASTLTMIGVTYTVQVDSISATVAVTRNAITQISAGVACASDGSIPVQLAPSKASPLSPVLEPFELLS